MNGQANEIENLLEQLFIFPREEKKRILAAVRKNASAKILGSVLLILKKALEAQDRMVARKIASDPGFIARAAKFRRMILNGALKDYKISVRGRDSGKINIITSKIKEI